MAYNKEIENISDFLNTLELKYTNNHFADTLEKKYNKLLNTEITPHIEVILCQYYLVILGGDYMTEGLLNHLKSYLHKLRYNKDTIENMNISNLNKKNKERLEKLRDIILVNEKKYHTLYLDMINTYNQYIQTSKTNIECSIYNLYQLHSLQLITYHNINNNIDSKHHIEHLKKEFEYLNKMLLTEKEDIFIKFIDSQISVIEQQLDLLKV